MAETIAVYVQAVITVGALILGGWGFYKVLKEIKKENDDEHDRRQKWDKAADTLAKKENDWDKGLKDVFAERGRIVERYDKRLDAQDEKMEMVKSEQEAKNQQLLAMMCMCLRAQDAILEALVEQGIGNGDIKTMHKELKDFILDQVQ